MVLFPCDTSYLRSEDALGEVSCDEVVVFFFLPFTVVVRLLQEDFSFNLTCEKEFRKPNDLKVAFRLYIPALEAKYTAYLFTSKKSLK